jgi:hypothetical protein
VDPRIRTAALISGLAFCVIFGLMTLVVAASSGVDVLVVVSLVIVAMIGSGLYGAINNPPDD